MISILNCLLVTRNAPPTDSGPEAGNFPDTHYEMSSDPNLFKAPDRYPEPPTDMYYETPKTPTYQKPAAIFPWEHEQAVATRIFPEDDIAVRQAPSTFGFSAGQPPRQHHRNTSSLMAGVEAADADPWQSYSRGNAWDSVPEIGRYVGNLQKRTKGAVQVIGGSDHESPSSVKLTDFPTELERPSLPVTPAPIRRHMMWGEERNEHGELPAAEGVPSQEDWVCVFIIILQIGTDPTRIPLLN